MSTESRSLVTVETQCTIIAVVSVVSVFLFKTLFDHVNQKSITTASIPERATWDALLGEILRQTVSGDLHFDYTHDTCHSQSSWRAKFGCHELLVRSVYETNPLLTIWANSDIVYTCGKESAIFNKIVIILKARLRADQEKYSKKRHEQESIMLNNSLVLATEELGKNRKIAMAPLSPEK